MANLTKEDIRSVIEIIKELYLEDMIPWICGYSGGKDSTAVVQLVWYALQELPREKLKKPYMLSVQILWLSLLWWQFGQPNLLKRWSNLQKNRDFPLFLID